MSEGFWRYAVRQVDEDGDVVMWTGHGGYNYEPFTSVQDARDFASHWLDDFEIVRQWVPKTPWEVVPDDES